jgi:hypothetical protein
VATVQDTHPLRWWPFSFGPQVEVLQPSGLRKEFSELVHQRQEEFSTGGKGCDVFCRTADVESK